MFTTRSLPCRWCAHETLKVVNVKIPASLCCYTLSLSLSWPKVCFINICSRLWEPTGKLAHKTRLETKLFCTHPPISPSVKIWSTVGDVTFPLRSASRGNWLNKTADLPINLTYCLLFVHRPSRGQEEFVFVLAQCSVVVGVRLLWTVQFIVNVLSSVSLFSVLRTVLHIKRVGPGLTRFIKSWIQCHLASFFDVSDTFCATHCTELWFVCRELHTFGGDKLS